MRQRFDITENLEKFCKILKTKQPPSPAAGPRALFSFILILLSPQTSTFSDQATSSAAPLLDYETTVSRSLSFTPHSSLRGSTRPIGNSHARALRLASHVTQSSPMSYFYHFSKTTYLIEILCRKKVRNKSKALKKSGLA